MYIAGTTVILRAQATGSKVIDGMRQHPGLSYSSSEEVSLHSSALAVGYAFFVTVASIRFITSVGMYGCALLLGVVTSRGSEGTGSVWAVECPGSSGRGAAAAVNSLAFETGGLSSFPELSRLAWMPRGGSFTAGQAAEVPKAGRVAEAALGAGVATVTVAGMCGACGGCTWGAS